MSGAVGPDAWRRGLVGWHAVFGTVAVLTAVLIAGDDGLGGRRFAALGLLVVLCAWYVLAGMRALDRDCFRSGLRYLVVAAPLTVAVFAFAPVGGLLLVVLYPHIWVLLPSGHAVVGSVAVVAAVSGVILGEVGLTAAGLLPAVAYAVVGLLVALGLGLWITRIIEQSQQRAELIAELAATRDELAKVSREAGVLAERARVARDIHDTLAQGFASVLLQLEAVAAELPDGPDAVRHHLAAAQRTTRANLAEARSLIAALSPPDLRAASLPEALERLVDRQELGVPVSFQVTGEPRALPANGEVVLFRAVQEGLANAGKHAGARRVEVEIGYRDCLVCLRIRDDGAGFDPDAPTGGFGLSGMRARVVELGGDMIVDSAPGAGTTLRVELRCP